MRLWRPLRLLLRHGPPLHPTNLILSTPRVVDRPPARMETILHVGMLAAKAWPNIDIGGARGFFVASRGPACLLRPAVSHPSMQDCFHQPLLSEHSIGSGHAFPIVFKSLLITGQAAIDSLEMARHGHLGQIRRPDGRSQWF